MIYRSLIVTRHQIIKELITIIKLDSCILQLNATPLAIPFLWILNGYALANSLHFNSFASANSFAIRISELILAISIFLSEFWFYPSIKSMVAYFSFNNPPPKISFFDYKLNFYLGNHQNR